MIDRKAAQERTAKLQALVDVGFNAFAVELVAESAAQHVDGLAVIGGKLEVELPIQKSAETEVVRVKITIEAER